MKKFNDPIQRRSIRFRICVGVLALIILAGFFFSAGFGRPKVSQVVKGASGGTSARAMCTLDVDSGRIFYEKNAMTAMPMASTTKIVTAISCCWGKCKTPYIVVF
jgi:D-alanyl-D-alanine carboxypeptidase